LKVLQALSPGLKNHNHDHLFMQNVHVFSQNRGRGLVLYEITSEHKYPINLPHSTLA